MDTQLQFRQVIGVLITLVLVFLTARLGGVLTIGPYDVSLFWPPNAILLSAMLMLDRRYALVCLALCFPMYTAAELWSGYAAQNAALFSLANCVETGGAFLIITKYLQAPYTFVNFYNFLVFLFAIVLAAVLGSVIGAYSIYLLGGHYTQAFTGWLLGDFIAFLMLTPLLLTLREWPAWLRDASRNSKLEAVSILGLMLFLLAVAYGAFGLGSLRFVGIQVVAVGLIFIAAIRFGVKGCSITTLLFTLVIFSLQLKHFGAFVELSERSGVVGMQVYFSVVIFSSVSLAILIAERDAAFAALKLINVNLGTLVTERSNELLSRTRQLAKAQKMEAIGKVTGGVAHDFNNLLAVIQGNAELVEHSADDGKYDREIASIKAAVASGSTMTHSLLAYSRKTILSPKITNICELITSRIDIFQRLMGETVVLTHHTDDEIWQAMIDAHRFEDALLNLVVNARDAMKNGGQLHLTVENIVINEFDNLLTDDFKTGSYVLLTVMDTGSGIQPELLSRVFDPFFTTKEFGEGSGLGLSMVYGFAKQSGGHLTIESNQGKSTTVRLYLPRAEMDEDLQKKDIPKKIRKHANRKSCRILVVEDNPIVMEICKQLLTAHGHVVVSAVNGRQALATLEDEGPFDILFSDIILPDNISGFDIQREANLLQPGIESILTTGYIDLTSKDTPLLIENFDILYKPYTTNDLLDRIESSSNN